MTFQSQYTSPVPGGLYQETYLVVHQDEDDSAASVVFTGLREVALLCPLTLLLFPIDFVPRLTPCFLHPPDFVYV